MKLWISAVAGVCLLVPNAFAQQPVDAAKRAKVEELFTVMRLDHTMDQLMAAIRQQTGNIVKSAPGFDQMTPEQKKITEQFQQKVMATAMETVGWKAMEPDMLNLYASTYSTQEIDGIIAFYKSPVGQTMLDKTPELSQKSIAITQERAKALQPKLQQMLTEYRQQMTAAAPVGPAATPGASRPAAGASTAPKKP